ncbi:hypothetical protein RA19_14530 [Leisingera sp. ANG-M1]|nr:hypothetical protein RA19_14530 [Leisingera sp. ANG-M1]
MAWQGIRRSKLPFPGLGEGANRCCGCRTNRLLRRGFRKICLILGDFPENARDRSGFSGNARAFFAMVKHQ